MIYPPNKELLLRYDSMFGWGDSLISFIGVEKEETICLWHRVGGQVVGGFIYTCDDEPPDSLVDIIAINKIF